MSWFPKRDKLDPVQASVIDFIVAQDGNFYISGEAGTGKSVVLAHIAAKFSGAECQVARASFEAKDDGAGCGGMIILRGDLSHENSTV